MNILIRDTAFISRCFSCLFNYKYTNYTCIYISLVRKKTLAPPTDIHFFKFSLRIWNTFLHLQLIFIFKCSLGLCKIILWSPTQGHSPFHISTFHSINPFCFSRVHLNILHHHQLPKTNTKQKQTNKQQQVELCSIIPFRHVRTRDHRTEARSGRVSSPRRPSTQPFERYDGSCVLPSRIRTRCRTRHSRYRKMLDGGNECAGYSNRSNSNITAYLHNYDTFNMYV